MEEVLRFCKDTEDKALTILVVGSEQNIQPLSASIIQANNSQKLISELKVHKCESIDQVLTSGRPCAHVDYIAFCIDSRSAKVTTQIEEDIGHLSKSFLLSRICLILCLFGGMSDLDMISLVNLQRRYQLHQLNGTLNNENGRLQLSTRLLRLASYACGLVTGFPAVEQLYSHSAIIQETEDIKNQSTEPVSSDWDGSASS